ncbi:MAG: SDR family oxidoreductase [Pseudomonadota bacterium]
MTNSLNGQVALVTGAGRGIGRAIALRLAKDGADVILHYGNSEAAAEDTANLVRETGRQAQLLQADLADPNAGANVGRQAAALLDGRRLNILINNAGVAEFADLSEQTVDNFDRQFAVNVRAPFFITQALADHLSDDARLIYLSSIVAKSFFPGIPAYSMTKGAIDTLVTHFASIFGPKGIRVNAIAPGAIQTDMSPWLNTDEGAENALSIQALQRVGQAEDIARAVAFAAGPDSDWVTGQVIQVSGGSKL